MLLIVLAIVLLAAAAYMLGEAATAPARERQVSVKRASTYGKFRAATGEQDRRASLRRRTRRDRLHRARLRHRLACPQAPRGDQGPASRHARPARGQRRGRPRLRRRDLEADGKHGRAADRGIRAHAQRDPDRRGSLRRLEEDGRAVRHTRGLGLRPRDRSGRSARHFARPHPARAGGRFASAAPGRGRGEGDEGPDQDALPDRDVHLPGDVPGHPRARVPQPVQDLLGEDMAPRKKDTTNETNKKEFGTGLRAQLERRREEPEAPKIEAQPNVELRFELTARPASDAEPITVVSDGATEDLRRQLAAAKAREEELQLSAERHEQAEAKLRELKAFDRDRSKFGHELEKQRKTLADREKKLSRAEQELETRERAGIVKLEGRERALAKREEECRARDKEVSERERKFGAREADLKKEAARVGAHQPGGPRRIGDEAAGSAREAACLDGRDDPRADSRARRARGRGRPARGRARSRHRSPHGQDRDPRGSSRRARGTSHAEGGGAGDLRRKGTDRAPAPRGRLVGQAARPGRKRRAGRGRRRVARLATFQRIRTVLETAPFG